MGPCADSVEGTGMGANGAVVPRTDTYPTMETAASVHEEGIQARVEARLVTGWPTATASPTPR